MHGGFKYYNIQHPTKLYLEINHEPVFIWAVFKDALIYSTFHAPKWCNFLILLVLLLRSPIWSAFP